MNCYSNGNAKCVCHFQTVIFSLSFPHSTNENPRSKNDSGVVLTPASIPADKPNDKRCAIFASKSKKITKVSKYQRVKWIHFHWRQSLCMPSVIYQFSEITVEWKSLPMAGPTTTSLMEIEYLDHVTNTTLNLSLHNHKMLHITWF